MYSNNELLAASAQSKQFFFENFYKIPDIVNGGLINFLLRPFQRQILMDIDHNDMIIGLKARQIGWTTIAVANALHDVLFNEWRPWTFISRNEKAAQDMVSKATIAYYRLPSWMRKSLPRLDSETQGGLHFANGSRIDAEPATGSSFRGDAVYGLLMDECAFMEYAEDIWGAVEAGVKGPKMLFSTANGMGNFFHDIWLDAQQPFSAWHPIFYPWHTVAERDELWYSEKKLAYRGREWLFYQEYPASSEEAFAKSGRVAFPQESLQTCFEKIMPARRLRWDVGIGGGHELGPDDEADVEIIQWKLPEVQRDKQGRPLFEPNYVVGVDVSEGLDHGDWTYVTVFDANTYEQVLSSKSAIPVSYLSDMLNWIGEEYFNALMVIEHNNHGVLPIDRLYRDYWYPRLYRQDTFASQRRGDRTPRYGWMTTKGTKPKMVHDFIQVLSTQNVVLHDPDFLMEANTFVADGKGSYSATAMNHDDVIMGTLIAWQGVLDSPQYPIIWSDPVQQAPTHDDMDELFFPVKKDTAAHKLDAPLGQADPVPVKKSVILMPANWSHWREKA